MIRRTGRGSQSWAASILTAALLTVAVAGPAFANAAPPPTSSDSVETGWARGQTGEGRQSLPTSTESFETGWARGQTSSSAAVREQGATMPVAAPARTTSSGASSTDRLTIVALGLAGALFLAMIAHFRVHRRTTLQRA